MTEIVATLEVQNRRYFGSVLEHRPDLPSSNSLTVFHLFNLRYPVSHRLASTYLVSLFNASPYLFPPTLRSKIFSPTTKPTSRQSGRLELSTRASTPNSHCSRVPRGKRHSRPFRTSHRHLFSSTLTFQARRRLVRGHQLVATDCGRAP
jgi:hypothetical protein